MASSSGISSSSPASIQEIKRNNKRKFEGYLPYEQYVQLKNDFVNHHARICDICRKIVFGSRKVPPSKILSDTQVEDMILSHLEVIYKKVIKDLTSYGYPKDAAVRAVLATGICYGCRDSITNALKHALTFLMCGMGVEEPKNHNVDKDLKTLVGFVTMVEYNGRKRNSAILRLDDFLFWLLMHETPHFDSSLPHSMNDSKLKLNTIRSNPDLSLVFLELGFPNPTPNAATEKPIPPYDSLADKCSSLMISESSIPEEKAMDDSLKHEVSSNRGSALRHHLERRRQYSRLPGKGKKKGTSPNQFLEKPKITLLHSSSSLLKFGTADGLKTSESVNVTSMPFGASSDVSSKPDCGATSSPCFKISAQGCMEERSDEMLEKLTFRSKDLQIQLQEWTNWTHFKVMETARKLQRDKAELQALRQQKSEAAKKNGVADDSTIKKIEETESALSWARTQFERATDATRDLETEKIRLKQELEAAKAHDKASAADSQEASLRELTTLKKIQSWEKERALLQEELSIDKRKLSKLQKQLQEAQGCHDQLEARWRNEEKLKLEQLTGAINERKEREQVEASAKSKEDMIKSESESHMQKYRDDIQKLRHQIAELNLMIESLKFLSLDWAQNAYFTTDTKGFKKSEIGEVEHDWECVMCLMEEISVVFLPCAHQVVCTKCNELHEKQGLKDCPFCRTPIQHRICIQPA